MFRPARHALIFKLRKRHIHINMIVVIISQIHIVLFKGDDKICIIPDGMLRYARVRLCDTASVDLEYKIEGTSGVWRSTH